MVSLCSGYDSMGLALDRLKRDYPEFDWTMVAWSEFDPETPNRPLEKQPAVVAHNALFPQWADRNLGDMTKIDWTQVPDFDLLFYSTPCFVAGTLVLTSEGYKPIEDVKVGDMVLTHTNQLKRVLDVGKKPANQIIKIRSMMFDEIFCTPNHPFLTRKRYRYGHKNVRLFKEPEWEAVKRDRAIDELVFNQIFDDKDTAVKAVNQCLIKAAEEQNVSLYTLCFHFVPDVEYEFDRSSNAVNFKVTLKPINFDFEHDGGYWKRKYYELKKQIQELINEKHQQ